MLRTTALSLAGGMLLALTVRAAPETPTGMGAPLTFTAARVTLKEAVHRLGEAAHSPPLLVTESLASQPVLMYLRDRTPRQAMDDAAWFYATEPGKCYWAENADGSLTLREDAAGRKARASRATERRNARNRRLVSEIKAGMQLGLLSEADLQRQRSTSPELAFAMPTYRRVFGLLAALNSTQREALLSGKPLSLRVGEMGAVGKDYADAVIGGLDRSRISVPPELGGGWIEYRRDRDLLTTPLIIRLGGRPDRPGIRMMLHTLPGSQAGVTDLLHPEAPFDECPPWLQEIMSKRADKKRKDRQAFVDRMRGDPQLAVKISLRARIEAPDPTQPGGKKVRACDLADALLQVADQSHLSVIGDYDPCWNDYYSHLDPLEPNSRMKDLLQGDLSEKPTWEVMEHIANRFQVQWGKRGNTIWVRSPRVPYALMDRIDVLDPPPLPNYWQKLLRTYKPGDVIPGVNHDP